MKSIFFPLCFLGLFISCRKENPPTTPPVDNPPSCADSLGLKNGIPLPVTGWDVSLKGIGPGARDLYFLSENTGFFIKSDNALFKTEDGGESWQEVFKAPDYIPECLSFADKNTGFMSGKTTGNIFALYKTDDGGAHWTKVASNQQASVANLHFVNASRGFATITIFNNSLGILSPRLIRTDDGGQHWTPLPSTPVLTDHYEATLYQMLSPDTGYFAGFNGYLYRTFDGGHSFDSVKTSLGTIVFFQFFDLQHGLAANLNLLFKTSDGGAAWEAVGPYNNCEFSHFASPSEGLALRYTYDCLGNDVLYPVWGFFTTTDGGLSFENKSKSYNFDCSAHHFPAPGLGFGLWDDQLVKFKKQ